MKRIAVIADIHGNPPALDAVLDDIAAERVDEIIVAGDLVGRGPHGSAVVARIRALGLPAISGNHEDYVLGARRGELPEPWHDTDVWDAARFMAAELTDEHAEYLAALPFSIARPDMRIVHGTPASNREGIGPWTDDATVRGHLASITEALLVCAHTHRPLVRQLKQGTVVNIGSVGLPFNRDQRAQYVIFHRQKDTWQPESRQVVYDVEAILRMYESSGFLARGGVTAKLLQGELRHATPLLVPFLAWAEAHRRPPSSSALPDFFAFHTPGASLPDFYRKLAALGEVS